MSESAHLCPAGFGDDEARESADVPAHDAPAISASTSAAFMIQPPRRGPSTALRGVLDAISRVHVRSTLGARLGGGGLPDPLGGELRERPIDPREDVLARIDRDRKSTRLNSSHSQISYAVFCLKKKKMTYQHRRFRVYNHHLLVRHVR